ncbi:YkgJ family cysteine cluster protein [Pseudothermotoga thermarum]|uniref:YkgJ family cysteine cluster protein n=1 Tax=Pseudothermotoga thermarum DSM 5069 TaxID=688269 RepID=F7YYM2_9THEM|nr:YkgJ family cysteine cluster protein [Pseudothermotoga thermarum]AEH51054.1 hypothetical protein Theth_0971 [Pseudothermotoga thermarum DSM 5069]
MKVQKTYLNKLYEKAEQVMDLYKKFDKRIELIRPSLPACPYGCRDCCLTDVENIEASILEFFPLVIKWHKENVLVQKYEEYKAATESSLCVFLQPDHTLLPQGGCTIYEFRPLVCRLFGSSALLKKRQLDYLACKKLKSQSFDTAMLPIANDFNDKLITIDPYLAVKKYPINEALKKALEYVLSYDYFFRATAS